MSHSLDFVRHTHDGSNPEDVTTEDGTSMDEHQWLAEQFEENRGRLRAVAFRMTGSLSEAEDAVQEAWLRLSRAEAEEIDNLGGWLTTVVARVCLDMLRSRKSRREESLDAPDAAGAAPPEPAATHSSDPEHEALLADSVGLALLVVLDRLAPAERLAFVLHDMFDLDFQQIGSIVGRTPTAARQLASRARRRVRGAGTGPEPHPAAHADPDLQKQRRIVDAFLTALRAGDFQALVALLDPDLVVHADVVALPGEVRGAEAWARQAITAAKGAKFARVALVDGAVGAVVAPRGKLFRALRFTFANGRIARIDVVGGPEGLAALDLAVLDDLPVLDD
ncbi:MAG TPA: sigma-70 family RNA polymerase sigma factor [Terracidiphilus sp.]|nr:sigma-70 family RNA polymerase sigma factor [Terracidiphilus sp.]